MTGATRKLARGCPQLSKLKFRVFQRAGVKHHAANTLLRVPPTGMDESSIEDDISILTRTETHSEGVKTITDAKHLHSLSSNGVLDTAKPALLYALQESEENNKIRRL